MKTSDIIEMSQRIGADFVSKLDTREQKTTESGVINKDDPKVGAMTPSTDTLKQEESWEDEFKKYYLFTPDSIEFIRNLIHQTQQAERKRVAELAKKVTSAVQSENFKRVVDEDELAINIEDFNDATQELLIRLLKKLEEEK